MIVIFRIGFEGFRNRVDTLLFSDPTTGSTTVDVAYQPVFGTAIYDTVLAEPVKNREQPSIQRQP
jgi:hypothetical protein